MANPVTDLSVHGRLSEGDVKRLTRQIRGGTVGPTALYYAGVTAPIISAGIALVTKSAFGLVGMTNYWQVLLSAIVAAMAGIVWYLIFMRWSYRHRHGRSVETQVNSEVTLMPDYLKMRRGNVETRIGYDAVTEVIKMRKALLIRFDGAQALMLPNRWFPNDESRAAFRARLEAETKT